MRGPYPKHLVQVSGLKSHAALTLLHTHAKYLHGGHVIKSTVQLFCNGLALSFCAFICRGVHTAIRRGTCRVLWKAISGCSDFSRLPSKSSIVFSSLVTDLSPNSARVSAWGRAKTCQIYQVDKFVSQQHFKMEGEKKINKQNVQKISSKLYSEVN